METIVKNGTEGVEHRAIGARNHVVTNRRSAIDEDVERAPSRGVYLDAGGTRRIVGAGQPVPDGWKRIDDADISDRRTNSIEERAGARAAERAEREDKADRSSREAPDRATRRGDKAARTDEDRQREQGDPSPTTPTSPSTTPDGRLGPEDYAKAKQPALKAELDARGIPYKKGAVKNADLVKLLKADDKAKAR